MQVWRAPDAVQRSHRSSVPPPTPPGGWRAAVLAAAAAGRELSAGDQAAPDQAPPLTLPMPGPTAAVLPPSHDAEPARPSSSPGAVAMLTLGDLRPLPQPAAVSEVDGAAAGASQQPDLAAAAAASIEEGMALAIVPSGSMEPAQLTGAAASGGGEAATVGGRPVLPPGNNSTAAQRDGSIKVRKVACTTLAIRHAAG